MATNEQIARDVIDAVGGKDNIVQVVHCMTRLRFNLHDGAVPSDDAVKGIDGVLGVQRAGGQYQVIIGQNVSDVYRIVCQETGLSEQKGIDENLDGGEAKPGEASRGPLTLKRIGAGVLDYLSGSIAPIVPIIMVAGLFKAIQVILSPTLLGVIAEGGDLYVILDFIYYGAFYYLPFFVGYSAARKVGASPVLGMLLAGMLLAPDFIALASEGGSLSLLGIPVRVSDYSQSLLPLLLSCWVLGYVERFFRKIVPDALRTVFVPFCTVLVMVPLTLCLLAPLGSVCGELFGSVFYTLSNSGGLVAVIALAVLTAIQPFLVVTGMHMAIAMIGLAVLMQNGFEGFSLVANGLSNFAVWPIALAAAIRFKGADRKAESLGFFISGFIGGVVEPTIYGVCFKYPRVWAGAIAGGFVGGLWMGITNTGVINPGASSVFGLLGYVSAELPNNFMNACIAAALAFVVSLVVTLVVGFTSKNAPAAE